jgi:hypothetical protein
MMSSVPRPGKTQEPLATRRRRRGSRLLTVPGFVFVTPTAGDTPDTNQAADTPTAGDTPDAAGEQGSANDPADNGAAESGSEASGSEVPGNDGPGGHADENTPAGADADHQAQGAE